VVTFSVQETGLLAVASCWFPGSLRVLLVGCSCGFLDTLGRRILCFLDAFHESDDLHGCLLERVEPLSINLLLPGLRSPEQQDVGEFVWTQFLSIPAWRDAWKFLVVDAHEVVGAFANLHVARLAAFSAQVAFDLLKALAWNVLRNDGCET